jgi:hypothetical protein
MSKFPTFSMAGIGIAAAIGFVFVLSYFNSISTLDTGDDVPSFMRQQSSPEPSSLLIQQQNSEDDQAMFANKMETTEATGNESSLPESETDAGSTMQQAPIISPTLESISASNGTSGELIGDLTPEMKFAVNEPVFIKATLVNPSGVMIPGHLVSLGISAANENVSVTPPVESRLYQDAATFHGDISANSSVEVELYWNPTYAGDYVLTLFSIDSDQLASEEPIMPIEYIPIHVAQ